MQRTQILLDHELKQSLVRYARASHTSVSNVIRTFLRRDLLTAPAQKSVGAKGLAAVLALSKPGGPRNLSDQVDETLYQR